MLKLVDEFDDTSGLHLMHEILEKNSELLKISLDDIRLATEDFNRKYYNGSFKYFTLCRVRSHHFDQENPSSVEGRNKEPFLQRHEFVVLKRFRRNDLQGELFYAELKMCASVKHRNIINLLGFCVEDDEKILVFEDLSREYLEHNISKNGNKFPWEKRVKICIDVARALHYLHFEMEEKKVIICRNINGRGVAFDKNFEAKVVDLGQSVLLPPDLKDEALYIGISSDAPYYIDPEYKKSGKLKRESDVYSFGVLLFEILFGRFDIEGLVYKVRQCINTGALVEMIDPLIKNETGENTFILRKGPSKDSLDTFIKIAYKCVAETQDQRPTMKIVVKKLEEALFLQRNNKDNPIMPLKDIQMATGNFNHKYYIGGGAFGKVYIGKLQDIAGLKTIVAKRLYGEGKQQFLNELQILLDYRHENIISLVGYCDEEDEKIIVYEYASRSSLDRYLNDASLTWLKRLSICIEVANALDFLHGGAGKQAKVVHRDIKTANILLSHDWKAKLADFGLSLISAITKETDYVIDRACGTPGYVDPLYAKSKFLTVESDIYSFGVVLFELLCGRSTYSIFKQEGHNLVDFIKKKFEEGKHEEVVFEKIREQIVSKSLITFQEIAYKCLCREREGRPTTKNVLTQLNSAFKFQISVAD